MDRSELLGLNKCRYNTVDLPTGGQVRIRSLMAAEMRTFRGSLTNSKGEVNRHRADRVQELLVAQCLVDDEGNRMFTDEDALSGVLDSLDGAVLAKLYHECTVWTGFAVDTDFAAVEDAIKNSRNGQATVSHS